MIAAQLIQRLALSSDCAVMVRNGDVLVPVVHVATITDDGHVHLYTEQAEPEQAEPEQAEPEQAEPLTLEQRIEALEKSIEALETRISEDTCYDFGRIADELNFDELANCCAERLNMREVARCVDMCDLAATIEVDLSDLAGYIDTEEIARHIDTEDIDLTDTVRDILNTARFRLE
jgi:hypothetical protein